MEIPARGVDHFRKRIANLRNERDWSQAEVAKKLTAMGIDNMHNTTVAKIEAGDREIKLDEAAALANLFGLSVDSLLGRSQGAHQDLLYALGALEDAVFTSRNELDRVSKSLQERLHEIPADYEGYESLAQPVREFSSRLKAARVALDKLVDRFTEEAEQRATERAINRLKRSGRAAKGQRA
jgi:transcriptional regulator with XRE-family HTH domain